MTDWRHLASIEGTSTGELVADIRILERGASGVLLELRFGAGVSSPIHRHDHDSYLYCLTGHLVGVVAGRPIDVVPGSSVLHPAGVDHSMTAVVDSSWLEFKSPQPVITELADGSLRIGRER